MGRAVATARSHRFTRAFRATTSRTSTTELRYAPWGDPLTDPAPGSVAELQRFAECATHYDERLLCLLMLLRFPRADMVCVTSAPPSPTIVDYYLHLLPGIPPSHAATRRTPPSVNDASADKTHREHSRSHRTGRTNKGRNPRRLVGAQDLFQPYAAGMNTRRATRHPHLRLRSRARPLRHQERQP